MARMAQTKNKQETAEYLEVSVRTLLRLVDQGKLAHMPKRRPTDETIFDVGEIDRYARQLKDEAAGIVSGVVAPLEKQTPARPAGAMTRRTTTAVALGTGGTVDALAMQDRMLRAFEALAAPPVAHKLTLSLVEAAVLSGLSRGYLRKAIAEKKLKARIIGRGWRVKREDLEAYIKKL
jgi:excisionase family DNA binding protein